MEKDGVKMRCLVCGRVVAGSEARLSAETGDCEGCQAEFKTLLGTMPADQALTIARANHNAREHAKWDALQDRGSAAVAAAGKKIADDWAKAVGP